MTVDIDELLLKCGMLDELKANSKKYSNIKDSKNLLASYEQHIFVWHDAGSCILTTEIANNELDENIKAITKSTGCGTSESHKFKRLTLTNPPVFDVESLSFNQTGSLISLSGKFGVMIYEVPWRYGKFRTSSADNNIITGRSWSLAEMFFSCTNRVQVMQTAWHPGSSSKTHIAVLCTDNYLRIYDVNDPQVPENAICLSVTAGSSFLSSDAKISFSSCYGESAVSFDFGPPENIQVLKTTGSRATKEYESKVVWPIFFVHGNGDVYILKAPLKKEKFQSSYKLEGPLAMFPAAEDNYGYDACAILCLPSTPVTLVIATATGMIYHCLVLDNTPSKENQEEELNLSETVLEECDEALYVFESVELPITLTEDQNDDVYSNPIRLYKDIVSNCKYHCTHVSGLHSVAILLLPVLENLDENSGSESLKQIMSNEQKHPCIVEHILCTKPFSQMKAVPLLGLDATAGDGGIILLVLLASWEFVSFPVVSSFLPPSPKLLSAEESTPATKEKYVSATFEKNLEKTLQRSLCSPFVKSFQSIGEDSSPKQWLDLLCSVTQRFREDYIQRLTTAQALLRSRVKVLNQQKIYQLKDIERCESEKDTLKMGAERLAEKFEDAQSIQQNLQSRIENLLKKLQLHVPYLSQAEQEMKQTLLGYEEKMKEFNVSLELIKKKLKHQQQEAEQLGDQSKKLVIGQEVYNKISLNDTQIKHVKELLSQEGNAIADLMQSIHLVKKQLGMGQ